MKTNYYLDIRKYLNYLFYLKFNFISIILFLTISYLFIFFYQYSFFQRLNNYERYIFVSNSKIITDKKLISFNDLEEVESYLIKLYIQNLFSYSTRSIENNYYYVKGFSETNANIQEYIENTFDRNTSEMQKNNFAFCYIQNMKKLSDNAYNVVFLTTTYNEEYKKVDKKYEIEIFFDINYDEKAYFKVKKIKTIQIT